MPRRQVRTASTSFLDAGGHTRSNITTQDCMPVYIMESRGSVFELPVPENTQYFDAMSIRALATSEICRLFAIPNDRSEKGNGSCKSRSSFELSLGFGRDIRCREFLRAWQDLRGTPSRELSHLRNRVGRLVSRVSRPRLTINELLKYVQPSCPGCPRSGRSQKWP